MDPTKYKNLLQYVKHSVYPECFTKQDKLVLLKFSKKFEYDKKIDSLLYLEKTKEGTVKRLVICEDQKSRVFEECHSATYAGHSGRDNTFKKIRDRYYWPDCYKDTVEMVNYKSITK